MTNLEMQTQLNADRSFERARAQAFVERVVGQLRGQPTDLLPFELVKDKLDLLPSSDRGLHDIPLERIVGSEGRYNEFTRSFLPRKGRVRQRWERVYAAVESREGVPPIEVYQVGDVYFVKDGNHRVSVARELGARTIQAHVIEYTGPVAIEADATLDDLILKAEKARFLQHTHLDDLHPEDPLELTFPGGYEKLEEHIAVHGYFLGQDRQCDICWTEAVNHWYQHVYLPMVRIIREREVLKDFPGRTEADLYLWIMEHRHYLAEELKQEIDLAQAAAHFAKKYSQRLKRVLGRASQRLGDLLAPDQLEAGPAPGQWRAERVQPRQSAGETPRSAAESPGEGPLLADILVPVDGSTGAWCALEQAITIVQRERSRLYGLYVAGSEADGERENVMREEFERRCDERGVSRNWIVEGGDAGRAIVARAHWADLVVLNAQGNGSPGSERALGATFQTVARRAPRPVLAALGTCSSLSKALLAYDGSPESEEALFVAAYLGRQWGLPLAVVTVEENRRADQGTLQKAVTYLSEHGAQAQALLRHGDAAEAILAATQELGCDWLIMGSSGYSPFGQLFTRSTVQRVLREAPCPVLLCR